MDLPDNNNIVKKLEKDDRLDFDAILEKGKRSYVNKKYIFEFKLHFLQKLLNNNFHHCYFHSNRNRVVRTMADENGCSSVSRFNGKWNHCIRIHFYRLVLQEFANLI